MLTLHTTSKPQRTGTHIRKAQHTSGQVERPIRHPTALAGSQNRALLVVTSCDPYRFSGGFCLLFSSLHYFNSVLTKLYVGTLLSFLKTENL